MQVKNIENAQNAPREYSAIRSTFIKLPFVIITVVLSIFEWPFYTGFTVNDNLFLFVCLCVCLFVCLLVCLC